MKTGELGATKLLAAALSGVDEGAAADIAAIRNGAAATIYAASGDKFRVVVEWLGDEEAAAHDGYRLWVSEDRRHLARMWGNGKLEISLRREAWFTWGPPIVLTEEKV